MIRWWKFNLVGMVGVGVQLAALWTIVHFSRVPDLLATVLAVETALLHNFVWHELWTWRTATSLGRYERLLRFHLTSGVLSIASNVLLTWVFRESLGLPLLLANLAAISMTSVINFAMASKWVFRGINRGELDLPR
jgi:putative flippase GtrA